MTEFDTAKFEIIKAIEYLNDIYKEDFNPRIREVETWKFPIDANKRGEELIVIPKFFNQCSKECKDACIGMSYGWLYLYKYHCENKDSCYLIKIPPEKIIKEIWKKMNVNFQCEESNYRNMLETLLRPVRKNYFSDVKDKCLFDIGFEFRTGRTKKCVTDIFADGDDIMVKYECIYPESDKIISESSVSKEEELTQWVL